MYFTHCFILSAYKNAWQGWHLIYSCLADVSKWLLIQFSHSVVWGTSNWFHKGVFAELPPDMLENTPLLKSFLLWNESWAHGWHPDLYLWLSSWLCYLPGTWVSLEPSFGLQEACHEWSLALALVWDWWHWLFVKRITYMLFGNCLPLCVLWLSSNMLLSGKAPPYCHNPSCTTNHFLYSLPLAAGWNLIPLSAKSPSFQCLPDSGEQV